MMQYSMCSEELLNKENKSIKLTNIYGGNIMEDTSKLNVFKTAADWKELDQQRAATELDMVSENANEK